MSISDICNIVLALSGVATAVSAIVAVVHFKKHWRDDDVFATLIVDDERLHRRMNGLTDWSARLRVVNSGKTPFTVYKATASEEVGGDPLKIVLAPRCEYPLDQGTYFETRAIVTTPDNKVALPEKFVIAVIDPKGVALGLHVVKLKDARPAR